MSERLDLLLAHLGQRVRLIRQTSCFMGLLKSGKYSARDAFRLARHYR